jgi:outer membrane protein OmpA-like peptidoglycan-associated protein
VHLENLSRIISLAFLIFPFALWGQDCTEWPDEKKLLKLQEKIEDTDDIQEIDELYREALTLSEGALAVQMDFNAFLINQLNAGNPVYLPKANGIAQKVLKLDSQCELYPTQLVFLMDVMFGQSRFNEFLDRFDGTSFEEDSLQLLEKHLIQEAKVWQKLLSPEPVNKEKVKTVSSVASEYLPFLSADGRYMYFTRKQTVRGMGSVVSKEQELFMRASLHNYAVEKVDKMPRPFNYGNGNYGGMTCSLSGDELFLTVCNATETGYRNCDIFQIIENLDSAGNAMYSEFELLPSSVNTDTTWESQPALSSDGKTLYFAKFPGAVGGIDIYAATRNDDGSWNQAEPVRGDVNTAYNEKAPFIHADNKHLYFASDQNPTLGAYDLFYAESKAGNWSNIKNMSSALNTTGDEHGIQIAADGKTAYISSNIGNRTGVFDIFKLTLPEAYQSEYRKVITGSVKYLPEENLEITLSNEKGDDLAKLKPKKSNHRFATLLTEEQARQKLLLKTEAKGDSPFFNATKISPEGDARVDIDTDAMLHDQGGFTLENVLFGSDDAIVAPKSMIILKAFAQYLQEIKFGEVKLIGHTDNQGEWGYNLNLSDKRAKAVGDLLIEFGVDESKIVCIGKGDAEPLLPNTTDANKAVNRRTEVQITP